MAGQQTTIASLSNSDSGLCRPGTSGTDQNRVESARQSIVPLYTPSLFTIHSKISVVVILGTQYPATSITAPMIISSAEQLQNFKYQKVTKPSIQK